MAAKLTPRNELAGGVHGARRAAVRQQRLRAKWRQMIHVLFRKEEWTPIPGRGSCAMKPRGLTGKSISYLHETEFPLTEQARRISAKFT
jgi:hypothetical protein